MDITSSLILGIVQGATEFLPISSSGHLILAREVMGLNVSGGLAFDAVLQLATALAVFIYFRVDFWHLIQAFVSLLLRKRAEAKEKTLLFALILGTIPAMIFGLLLENYMETTFRTPLFVVVTLLLGSLLFYVAERAGKQNEALTVKKGLWVGFFQSLALFPGTSRSGATISGGLIFGLTREEAARFSFLLSFPIIFGSGLLKAFDMIHGGVGLGEDLLVGSAAAFIVGICAIHYLLRYLRHHTLNIFIWYRIILAGIVLVVLL